MSEENTMQFMLKGHEYVALSNLLKFLGLVGTGGEAKIRIQSGEAAVNGEEETRRGKKLRTGDVVTFDGKTISIIK